MIKASGRSFDLEQIERAYQVASEAHKEQKENQVNRILRILLPQLAFWWNWVWIPCVVAGLLHDVVEDTDITLEEITKCLAKKLPI